MPKPMQKAPVCGGANGLYRSMPFTRPVPTGQEVPGEFLAVLITSSISLPRPPIENLHLRRHLPISPEGEAMDSQKLLAVSIIIATLVIAWMFRYETITNNTLPFAMHRNRFTGAVCLTIHECWWRQEWEKYDSTEEPQKH